MGEMDDYSWPMMVIKGCIQRNYSANDNAEQFKTQIQQRTNPLFNRFSTGVSGPESGTIFRGLWDHSGF